MAVDRESESSDLAGEADNTVIVVGVDGSETARTAADRAAAIAAATGARLHLVSAIKQPRSQVVRGPGGDTWYLDDIGDTQQQLQEMAARWADVDVTTACPIGKPADAIIGEAQASEADMIVVGNRRMQGISRVLGAVADEIVHNAPCDVLIVKTTG